MNPQDILMYGHRTVLHTAQIFPKDHVYDQGAVGYWSAKDVIAHLASYELVLVEVLQDLLNPCPSPLREELSADGQAFNDRQVDELRKDHTFEQVLDEYNSAYAQAADLAGSIPREMWWQKGLLPWYGPEYDLEDFIAYTYYGHKREHCGQLQTFRDRFLPGA